jgi:hypothetical protein
MKHSISPLERLPKMRLLPRFAQAAALGLTLGGCERAPSINLLGAFFPSWMLCVAIGILLTLVARWVLVAAGVDTWLSPRGVVYPAFALALSLAAWLVLFRG